MYWDANKLVHLKGYMLKTHFPKYAEKDGIKEKVVTDIK